MEPEVQRMRHEAYSQRRHEMMRLCRQERKRLLNAEQKVCGGKYSYIQHRVPLFRANSFIIVLDKPLKFQVIWPPNGTAVVLTLNKADNMVGAA